MTPERQLLLPDPFPGTLSRVLWQLQNSEYDLPDDYIGGTLDERNPEHEKLFYRHMVPPGKNTADILYGSQFQKRNEDGIMRPLSESEQEFYRTHHTLVRIDPEQEGILAVREQFSEGSEIHWESFFFHFSKVAQYLIVKQGSILAAINTGRENFCYTIATPSDPQHYPLTEGDMQQINMLAR